ncbi:hypothetical protein acdb102_18270 [Acidothermaceae bacterium B102]|nr:hypothetical protein acdb102_18270 [Acidothermaceae bacterium B102]
MDNRPVSVESQTFSARRAENPCQASEVSLEIIYVTGNGDLHRPQGPRVTPGEATRRDSHREPRAGAHDHQPPRPGSVRGNPHAAQLSEGEVEPQDERPEIGWAWQRVCLVRPLQLILEGASRLSAAITTPTPRGPVSVLSLPTVDKPTEQIRTGGPVIRSSAAGRPDLWITAAVEALQDFRTSE